VNRHILALVVVLSAVVAAGAFAFHRYDTFRGIRRTRELVEAELEAAVHLARQQPRSFGREAPTIANPAGLKTLAENLASRRSVTIGYLSESERELEKGHSERQVVIRVINVPHASLVRFLSELEEQGAGAKVKEIHLRPSRDLPETYEESEVVLSKVYTIAGRDKP